MATYTTELEIGDKRFKCTVRALSENGHQKYKVYVNERKSIFGRYSFLGLGFGFNTANKNETTHNTLDEAMEQLRKEIKRQLSESVAESEPAEFERRAKDVINDMVDENGDVEYHREHKNHY